MTNLILQATMSVCLLTNITETDNHRGCTTCDIVSKGYLIYHPWHEGAGQFIPPTEKYITTTITERKQVKFTVEGQPKELNEDKLLSSITETLRVETKWVNVSKVTNSVNPLTLVTNGLRVSFITYTNAFLNVTNAEWMELLRSITNSHQTK